MKRRKGMMNELIENESITSELGLPADITLTEEEVDALTEDDIMSMMQDTETMDEEVLTYLEKSDTGKPQLMNKIVVPEELGLLPGYKGLIYGYIREDSGYHSIIGWEGFEPAEELKASVIGAIGEKPDTGAPLSVYGWWTNEGLKFRLLTSEELAETDSLTTAGTELTADVYTMRQDIFSRNSGLIETSWMDEKCVVICGCGSVGSCIALQMARSGVGRFVLVDTDCVEIHNICRHQCSLADVGRYKVDAVAERIKQINPQAQIKKFYQRIQDVNIELYKEWISPGETLFIGTCDNRLGNAAACDVAKEFQVPFTALGFMTRAWAGEIFIYLPERNDICYRCAFKTQIDQSIVEERRNHFYVGEEDLEKANFEPGLDVDLEFGTSLFDKVILDVLNRNHPDYSPRLIHKMTQYTVFSGTDSRSYADAFWKKVLPNPISLRSLRYTDECRRCESCLRRDSAE